MRRLAVVASFWASTSAAAQSVLWEVQANAIDACDAFDYDGDGTDDVLWSAWSQSAVFVASGRDGSELLELDFLTQAFDMGTVLVLGPDLDGDGARELIATDPNYGTGDLGLVEAWSLVTTTALFHDEGFFNSSKKYEEKLGVAAALLGDVDLDGLDDFGYGAGHVHDGSNDFSRVYVRHGSGVVETLDLPGLFQSGLGDKLVGTGDVDGDGADDFAVGYGKVDAFGYVGWYSGDDFALIRSLKGEEIYDNFGSALANAGDLDADGVEDLLVGAPEGDDLGTQTGRVYAYSGATGAQLARVVGAGSGQRFGAALALVDDVDADGAADFVIGAPGSTSAAGRFHLVSGASRQLLSTTADPKSAAGFGAVVAPVGDLDLNGSHDLLVAGSGPLRAYSISLVPTVTSVEPALVDHRASTTLTLRGLGFTSAPPIEVDLDGVALGNVTVLSDTELTCDAVPLDPGFHAITVTNGYGSGTLSPGIAYSPIVTATGEFEPGGFVDLAFRFDRFDAVVAIYGLPPPVSVPVAPFDGTLQILPFRILFTLPSWLSDHFDVHVDLPDDPALTGVSVLVQSLCGPHLGGGKKDGAWADAVEILFP